MDYDVIGIISTPVIHLEEATHIRFDGAGCTESKSGCEEVNKKGKKKINSMYISCYIY